MNKLKFVDSIEKIISFEWLISKFTKNIWIIKNSSSSETMPPNLNPRVQAME